MGKLFRLLKSQKFNRWSPKWQFGWISSKHFMFNIIYLSFRGSYSSSKTFGSKTDYGWRTHWGSTVKLSQPCIGSQLGCRQCTSSNCATTSIGSDIKSALVLFQMRFCLCDFKTGVKSICKFALPSLIWKAVSVLQCSLTCVSSQLAV